MDISMDAFLDVVIDQMHKPQTAKNIAKTVAVTALKNLVTLPFGFFSFSMFHSKSKRELKKEFLTALYGRFKTGFFSSEEDDGVVTAQKNDLIKLFDTYPVDEKISILSLALKKPQEYQRLLDQWLTERSFKKSA